MGRKDVMKKLVLSAFSKSKELNSKLYTCNFCSQTYVLNVTRMSKHLKNNCVRCPNKIKIQIQQSSKALGIKKIETINTEILENKSSEIDSDGSDTDMTLSDSHPQSANASKSIIMLKCEPEESDWALESALAFPTTPNFTEHHCTSHIPRKKRRKGNRPTNVVEENNSQPDSEDEFSIAGKKYAFDLKAMSVEQRTIAEKLISDVIYYAKRSRLSDNSALSLNAT